jgi:hypothetical protein
MSAIKTETAERLPSSVELRERLCDLTASEAERRADAERLAGQLEGEIREAEHRERAEAARAELLDRARQDDAEAARLDALADERRTVLADVDAEIAKLTEQRMAMERAMQVDADLAERVLTSDPEEAGRLAGLNVGRSQALAGFAALITGAERTRQEIEARYSPPDGVGQPDGTLLFSPLTTGTMTERAAAEREEAARLRAKAASDPLAERPPERPEAAALTPTGMVMAGVALAARPDLFPPEPGPRNPFGYAPGTIAEAAASRPRRGRR